MRTLLAFVAALVLALPVPAHAVEPAASAGLQDPEAIEHFKRAQAHFNAEAYAKAVPELKAAYAIESNPMLLYAWAQAERLSGNCKKAVPLYERFLDTGPDDRQRRLAETNILDCSAVEDAEPGPSEDTAGDGGAVPDDDQPPDDDGEDEIKPAFRDWLGATFLSLGVATGVVGGVLLGVGRQEVADSPGASSEDAYFDAVAAGRTKHTAGIALLSVSGALVLAAIVRYAVLAGKNRKRRKAQTSLLVPERGFGLGLRVRF
jgi:tetratricopeptide (TPR) repeat protein